MVEFCADAGATDAIGGSATEQLDPSEAAEAATWGRSSAAPENRAEMQARKNMRVLDLLGAGGSKAAQELISNISIFSQKLSQKEGRNILQRELHDLMAAQAKLAQLLRGPNPEGAEETACDQSEMAAMTLLLCRAFGRGPSAVPESASQTVGDCANGEDDAEGAEWVFEPPHSDSWDWPLSRQERKERILMLSHIDAQEQIEDLRKRLSRRP